MKKPLKALVVCKHDESDSEANVCRNINLEGIEVRYCWKNVLKRKDLEGFDFVVAIGGDGTALSASHFLLHRPLLAVNSSPETSEGALTTITVDELERKMKDIRAGNFLTEKLERIEVLINGKPSGPLALNDVFVASEKAYLASKYVLRFSSGVSERQNSSGLIFSTGTGSTAWFKSAGGKPFSPQSRFIKMLVREPYIRKIVRFNTLRKTINEGEWVEVSPLTPMVLAIDSIREFKISPKDVVRIHISSQPLWRVK